VLYFRSYLLSDALKTAEKSRGKAEDMTKRAKITDLKIV